MRLRMQFSSLPLPNLAATENFARQMAQHAQKGHVLGLAGPLGSGKTAFARAFIRAFGIKEDVPSPTFTILQSYAGPHFPIHHFDLYRLKKEQELDELGFDEMLTEGIALIEWPQKAMRRLPPESMILHFTAAEDGAHSVALEPYREWIKRMEKLS